MREYDTKLAAKAKNVLIIRKSGNRFAEQYISYLCFVFFSL